jgi:hypothetical protein
MTLLLEADDALLQLLEGSLNELWVECALSIHPWRQWHLLQMRLNVTHFTFHTIFRRASTRRDTGISCKRHTFPSLAPCMTEFTCIRPIIIFYYAIRVLETRALLQRSHILHCFGSMHTVASLNINMYWIPHSRLQLYCLGGKELANPEHATTAAKYPRPAPQPDMMAGSQACRTSTPCSGATCCKLRWLQTKTIKT